MKREEIDKLVHMAAGGIAPLDPEPIRSAIVKALEAQREADAKVVEKRKEARWGQHGITEGTTNASYYPDHKDAELSAKDEEDEDLAWSIRSRPVEE